MVSKRTDEPREPADPSEQGVVLATLGLETDRIGIPAPPVPLRMHVQVRDNHAILQVHADRSDPEGVRKWAETLQPDRILERGSDHLCHLWLHYRPVPSSWSGLVTRFDLRHIHVEPNGRAEVTMTGTRDHVQAFVATCREEYDTDVEVLAVHRPDKGGIVVDSLTERQEEAVRKALDAGYYEVPRKVSLTELAKEMELSPSSLSELLRRGERCILSGYLDVGRREAAGRAGPS